MDQDPVEFSPPPNSATDVDGSADHEAAIDSNDSAWRSTMNISEGYHIIEYGGAAQIYGHGPTLMDKFDADEHASIRKHQLYYPFASRAEWELVSFLMESSLSMATLDRFLKLELVRFTRFYHSLIKLMPALDKKYRAIISYRQGSTKSCGDSSEWAGVEIKGLEDNVPLKEKASSVLSGPFGVPSIPYGKPIGQRSYFIQAPAAILKCRKGHAHLYGMDNGRRCMEDAGELLIPD
jgi:hypothetical protein